MAQKEELRKEFLKIKKEIKEKVRAKNQNVFTKNLNKNEDMLTLKFQIGRLDWLIIYIDKNKEEILEMFENARNQNQTEKSLIEALKNSYKSKIIFDWETRKEIVIEYDGKETLEKYSKYVEDLVLILTSVSIERNV